MLIDAKMVRAACAEFSQRAEHPFPTKMPLPPFDDERIHALVSIVAVKIGRPFGQAHADQKGDDHHGGYVPIER